MSETKFTPGEWIIDKYTLPSGREDYAILIDEKDGNLITIATVYGDDGNRERGIADAHLIAAAPEMYELLKQMKVLFEKQIVPISVEIENVLKKARGEE